MNIIIQIYMFVCVMLLLFNIGFLIYKNIKGNRFYPKDPKIQREIRKELESYKVTKKIEGNFKLLLTERLTKVNILMAFQNEIEDLECASDFYPYVFAQIDNYLSKPDYEQAYYTYIISTYAYDKNPVPEEFSLKFMNFLDTNSLYTFTNTMNAIYSFGETFLLINAIDKINEREGFYHKKLFVDGILSFKGNFEELNQKLLEKFDSYTPGIQECLLDYFRFKGADISDLCLKLISDKDRNSEIRYSAMRYFAKYPNSSSDKVFLDILADTERVWIDQMLAIQGLRKSNAKDVKKAIESKITSRNWYVRTNAIDYLHEHKISKDEIFDLLFLKDKYADEALLYQYRDDKEMSRYIINTIQMLNINELESEGEYLDKEFA